MKELDELLMHFAQDANKILKEELKSFNIEYAYAEARMYNIRSVGVQGDRRTYGYPCEIEIIYDKKFVWNQEEFTRKLSSRITNEVEKKTFNEKKYVINKVLYVLTSKANLTL